MTPGVVIYTSNRLEDLVEVLAERLAADPLPPLATETILVPGQGMARWLQFELAERHGIAAGLELPFPGAYLQQLVRAESTAEPDPFAPDVLPFRIHRLLGSEARQRELGLAASYCEHDADGVKRFQLSQRLATCFDHYQLYRRDLLAAAADGDDLTALGPHGPWQARLWRALLADAGQADPGTRTDTRRRRARANPTPLLFDDPGLAEAADEPPPAHRLARLERALADPERARALLPERLQVFGASTLPPALLSLLWQIARAVPVALYVPQPTPHYIGDLRPGRAPEGRSNDLLARLGTEVREFQDLLLDIEEAEGADCERRDLHGEIAGPPASLLACVQQGLAAVEERGDSHPEGRFAIRIDDDSLRVHDCHSEQRELEVVRDQILAAFDRDRTLAPHDVLVLVPDIERYAPYAEAVFGPVAGHLPFQVADKNPAIDSPIPASVCRVLRLARGRLPVFDVLHLLEDPAVQRRFGVFASDLPVLRHLCERAGIRWGLDGEMRERQFRVPPFEDNSWLQGIERMLVGVATGPVSDLVLGCLPTADTTSSRDDLLARFVVYLQTLFGLLRRLQRSHSLPEWADRLDQTATTLFEPTTTEEEQSLAELRRATTALRTIAERAAVTEPISALVLEDWLRHALRHASGGHGFLGGRVTIAAMLPMRAVPVQCLFLCGLDDQSFPRRDQPSAFDLAASDRRRGDRSARLDDRQMFLDCLLAARRQLHLTYVGHSQKDDSPCAPSAVLAELLDNIGRSCAAPAGFQNAHAFVTVRHPLQPWSPRYRLGDDARLFTFGTGAPRAAVAEDGPGPWSQGTIVVPPEPQPPNLPLDRLADFWWHPCRFFLRHVLRLRPPRPGSADVTTEPFVVSNLERYHLLSDAVEHNRPGTRPPDDALALARAGGLLPVGGLGAAAFAQVEEEAAQFLVELDRWGELAPRPVVARGPGVTIDGQLASVAGEAVVYSRTGKLQPKDRLRAWLLHVVTAVARDQGDTDLPERTVMVARDQTAAYGTLPPAVALEQLAALVDGYRLGITEPLVFFEKSSHAYGAAVHAGKTTDEALRAALREWQPQQNEFSFPDSADSDVGLCMRDRDPLHEPLFAEWARRIWEVARGYTGEVT